MFIKKQKKMKKLIYRTLFLAIVGIGSLGCNKEKNTNYNNNHQKDQLVSKSLTSPIYSVSNGLLKFDTPEDFDLMLQLPNEEILESLINLNYISYTESLSSPNDNLIQDEFLSAALNQDQAIQIGGYIFRVNKANESVYALPVNKSEMYNDLITENTSNQFILSFSTEDDVFDLLDSTFVFKSKNSDRKCSSSNDDGQGSLSSGTRYSTFEDENGKYGYPGREYKFHYKGQVRYDGWGLFKKLFTEFKHWESLWGTWDKTYFTINYTYNYVKKNGATGSSSSISSLPFDSLLTTTLSTYFYAGTSIPLYDFYDKHKEIIHYRGIRCLNKFTLSSTIWFRNRETGNPNKAYSRTIAISEIL